jgi:pimeloyl-ACP methyl ester carboxylesterase
MRTTAQLDTGTSQRVTLSTGTGPIAGLRAGRDGDPAVLFVPGYTGSKEDFGPLLDPLAAAGFCATAIDLPGQFESPGPDDPAAYSVDALGATVLAVAQGLGGPVRLVGHSFGGLVSRSAVITQPALFDSLVLLCSGPGALGGLRAERMQYMEPILAEGGMAGVYEAIKAVATTESGYVPPSPDLGAFLERRFLASSPAMLRGMGEALLGAADRVDELAATGLRVLVMYGVDDDAWTPAVQRIMAERLLATSVAIDNAAHSPAVEQPAATVHALLSFWAS